MKICFIIHLDFIESSYGGIETYLRNLSLDLTKKGHEVHIISGTEGKPLDYIYEGVNFHRVSSRASYIHNLLLKISPSIEKYFFQTIVSLTIGWRIYQKFRKLNKKKPFDIVECTDSAGLGVFFPLFNHTKSITRLHTSLSLADFLNKEEFTLDRKVIYFLERLQIKKSDALNADSFSLKEKSPDFFNIDPSKIDVTYYGINLSEYNSLSKKRGIKGDYLLYFGRLEERKGIRTLANSLPKVFSKYPKLKVIFVGNPHVEIKNSGKIENFNANKYILKANKNFSKNIIFIKHLSHKDLYPIIKNAKLVVLPSDWEAFGFTCLEAMGLGKPVLATSGSGFEEQIVKDGKYGFLVKPKNPEALSNKIIDCLKRNDLNIIGKRAKKRAEFFSNEKITQETINYYKKVIKNE